MSAFTALHDLYHKNRDQGLDNFPATVSRHFKNVLGSQQLPELNLLHPPESFPDGSLVLFRAMIQDTSLPLALYLTTRPDGKCGGWGIPDGSGTSTDVEYEYLKEAFVFWAVSIPGLAAWCSSESYSPALVSHQPSQPHKFPVPGTNHIGVQVKIYDENLAKGLRVTDLVSFVGILDSEPLQSNIDSPNSAQVPTLHVLFSTPIPSTIIPNILPKASLLPTVNTIREELITWIADEALAGDHTAAEWVLLCTISRVSRSRHPPILPLSLTISGFLPDPDDTQATPALYHVLSHLFPIVTLQPLGLDNLNNTPFRPESKDEDLHSGLLQQPKGAILLLPEGAVAEGSVFNAGLTNIRSAQQMMKDQTLEYVFPFSGFEFETDVNFVVTTESRQSTFFKTDINIPLRPTASEGATNDLYRSVALPPKEKLLLFRQLVSGSRIGSVTITGSMAKYIEDDFVRERAVSSEKTNGVTGGYTASHLIQRMVIARLIALSLHQEELSAGNWQRARELDDQTRKSS